MRDFVNQLFEADPNASIMVSGDLNDFQFGEPGEGSDHPLAILEGEGSEVPLINLVELEKEAERFTFVFDGNSQVLDHMLLSPGLLEAFVATDILHFNAGFASLLGDDPTTALRASDHDALEGRFVISSANSAGQSAANSGQTGSAPANTERVTSGSKYLPAYRPKSIERSLHSALR